MARVEALPPGNVNTPSGIEAENVVRWTKFGAFNPNTNLPVPLVSVDLTIDGKVGHQYDEEWTDDQGAHKSTGDSHLALWAGVSGQIGPYGEVLSARQSVITHGGVLLKESSMVAGGQFAIEADRVEGDWGYVNRAEQRINHKRFILSGDGQVRLGFRGLRRRNASGPGYKKESTTIGTLQGEANVSVLALFERISVSQAAVTVGRSSNVKMIMPGGGIAFRS